MTNSQQSAPSGEGSLVAKIAAEPIRALMSPEPVVVRPQTKLLSVLEEMRRQRSSCALVCDGDRLVGIFTERDYLDRVAGSPERLHETVAEHMSKDPVSLAPGASLGELLRIIVRRGFRHLPVVADEKVVGVVAAQDIVKYIAELFPAEVYNLPPQLDQVMPRVEGA
jgi:CBS domain-containing protein